MSTRLRSFSSCTISPQQFRAGGAFKFPGDKVVTKPFSAGLVIDKEHRVVIGGDQPFQDLDYYGTLKLAA